MKHYFGNDTTIDITSHQKSMHTLVKETIHSLEQEQEDAFFVGDLGDIIKKNKLWQACFPRVEPFYAMEDPLKSDRGRVYECSQCSFLGDRKTAVKHFKSHFRPEEHEYCCKICNFASSDLKLYKRHKFMYRAHGLKKLTTQILDNTLEDYTHTNPCPRKVNPEVDLRRWEAQPSHLHWSTKKRPSVATPLLNSCLSAVPAVPELVSMPVSTTIASSSEQVSISPLVTAVPTVVTVDSLTNTTSADVLTTVTDTRIVVPDIDTFVTDDISLPVPFSLPSPLKSPPPTVPRPVLPDITLPTLDVEEDITSQLLGTDELNLELDSEFPTLQSAIMELVNQSKKNNELLTNIAKLLATQNDNIQKVQLAVQSLSTKFPHPSATRPPLPPRTYNNWNNRSQFSRPEKRRLDFRREETLSPKKKLKSIVKPRTPSKRH